MHKPFHIYQEYEPSTGLRDIVRNFAAWTSIHGIPHIVLTDYWYLRLLWAIITLAAFGMVVFQGVTLFIQYFSWPVSLETSIEFTILTFPSVTFCNINAWKRSGIAGTPLQALVTAYESFDASTEFGFESPPTEAKQLRYGCVRISNSQSPEPPSPPKGGEDPATVQIGYSWQDLFISCTYNSVVCTEDDFQAFYDVYYGHCFTFNSKGNVNSTRAGPKFGLRAVMRIAEEEFLPWTSSAGALVYMDAQISTPFQDAYGYFGGDFSANGQASEFGLQFVQRTKLSRPFSNCTDTTEGVTQKIYYFNDYELTVLRRLLMCRVYLLTGMYGTIASALSLASWLYTGGVTDIGRKVMPNVWEMVRTVCYIPALQSYYQISLSTARWPARMYEPPECIAKNLNASEWWTSPEECIQFYKNNTLLVDIFFETNAKRMELESQGYPVYLLNWYNHKVLLYNHFWAINFIADSGGTVGLWLGMSAVSVIEAIIFLLLVAKWFIWKPAKIKIDPKFDYFSTLQQPQNYDLYPMDKEFTLPPAVQQSR